LPHGGAAIVPFIRLRTLPMSTSNLSSGRSSASSNSGAASDAVSLLTADHAEVADLFDEYETLVDGDSGEDERQALAERICSMLTVHATIEEEIFYPAAREVLDDESLLNEAEVEHATAKDLIEQIQSREPSDELYDAKVKVLGEYVNHHVLEEEGELFPQCQTAEMDLDELGEELSARKSELMEELGLTEEE
jgi:hemerythrin superfamily protein